MGCGGSKDTTTASQRRPVNNTNTANNKKGGGAQKTGGSGKNGKKKIQQEQIFEKGYKKRIRENLRNAAAGDDIEALEKSMEIFVNNKLEDGGDFSEAERRLEFLQIRKDIRDACMRNHPVVLDRSIKKVEASPYKRQLKPYLDRAYYLKQHQDELETFRHDVSNMEQSTISEIRSYHHPPPGVHETMIATYMVIGYPEDHLVDWTEITALMGRYGKDSLIREVQHTDPKTVDNNVALRARHYLGQYSLEEVRSVSSGAAAFHVWASQMAGKPDAKKTASEPTRKLTNSGVKGQQKGGNQPSTPNKSRENGQPANQQSKAKDNKASDNKAKDNKTKDNKQATANTQNANKADSKNKQNLKQDTKQDPKAAKAAATKTTDSKNKQNAKQDPKAAKAAATKATKKG